MWWPGQHLWRLWWLNVVCAWRQGSNAPEESHVFEEGTIWMRLNCWVLWHAGRCILRAGSLKGVNSHGPLAGMGMRKWRGGVTEDTRPFPKTFSMILWPCRRGSKSGVFWHARGGGGCKQMWGPPGLVGLPRAQGPSITTGPWPHWEGVNSKKRETKLNLDLMLKQPNEEVTPKTTAQAEISIENMRESTERLPWSPDLSFGKDHHLPPPAKWLPICNKQRNYSTKY